MKNDNKQQLMAFLDYFAAKRSRLSFSPRVHNHHVDPSSCSGNLGGFLEWLDERSININVVVSHCLYYPKICVLFTNGMLSTHLDWCHKPSHLKFWPPTKIICQDMYDWARQVALDAYKSNRLRNVSICVTFVFVYLDFLYTSVSLYLCNACICVFVFLIYLWARQVALDACLQNRPSCKSEDVSETRIFGKQNKKAFI